MVRLGKGGGKIDEFVGRSIGEIAGEFGEDEVGTEDGCIVCRYIVKS
jgi:hypothetical protein